MSFSSISNISGFEKVFSQLDEASKNIVLHKIKRFENLFKIADPNEAVYRELMRAMGYSKNKLQFLQLAHMVPYVKLMSLPTKELIEKVLLHKAGFADYSSAIEDYSDPTQHLTKESWVYYKVRPTNHPRMRISGMASLLYETKLNGLTGYFYELVKKSSGPSHIFKSIYTASNYKIGRGRAFSIFINVVLPAILTRS